MANSRIDKQRSAIDAAMLRQVTTCFLMCSMFKENTCVKGSSCVDLSLIRFPLAMSPKRKVAATPAPAEPVETSDLASGAKGKNKKQSAKKPGNSEAESSSGAVPAAEVATSYSEAAEAAASSLWAAATTESSGSPSATTTKTTSTTTSTKKAAKPKARAAKPPKQNQHQQTSIADALGGVLTRTRKTGKRPRSSTPENEVLNSGEQGEGSPGPGQQLPTTTCDAGLASAAVVDEPPISLPTQHDVPVPAALEPVETAAAVAALNPGPGLPPGVQWWPLPPESEWPASPKVTSLEDMMSWAADDMNTIESLLPAGAVQYIAAKLSSSTYSTSFSGIDSPGSAMCCAAAHLSERLGVKVSPGKHLSAVEWYSPSQAELGIHPSPPDCIFKDISNFWKLAVAKEMQSLKDSGIALSRSVMMPLIRQCGKGNLSTGAVHNFAWCVVHRKLCRVRQAQFHWSGFPCVAWSPQGKRKGEEGPDFEHWAAWAALRRAIQDRVVMFVCARIISFSFVRSELTANNNNNNNNNTTADNNFNNNNNKQQATTTTTTTTSTNHKRNNDNSNNNHNNRK